MECKVCMVNSHGNNHQFAACNTSHLDPDYEPVAPTLSLGKRILWLTETKAASGIVKWIGRIPFISPSWSAGIEFDNPMPNGGDGDFRGRFYFSSRRGHSLFLPISELITVDDDSPCNLVSREPAATPSCFPDSRSNFYYQRQRDSTYGHFRNNFCSNCERNDYQHAGSYCSHVPVYDRITSRRSLRYDDHPYEPFSAGLPCASTSEQRFIQGHENKGIQNGFLRNDYHHNRMGNSCSRHSTLQPIPDTRHSNFHQCAEDLFPDVEVAHKDSFFNPRSSSFRLISGIKEWVSCWVLGVTKQRRNSNIFIKGRKTIASLIVSRGSASLTGQRLSSFSEYATFNEYGPVKPTTKYSTNVSKSAESQSSPQDSRTRRKKRQAPLPPLKNQNSHQNTSVTVTGSGSSIVTSSGIDNSLRNYRKKRGTEKDKFVTQEISQSNVTVSYPNSIRRNRKKRQAPLPPHLMTANKANVLPKESVFQRTEDNQNSYNSMNSKLNYLHYVNRKEKLKHAQNVLAKINKQELSLSNPKLSNSKRKTFFSATNGSHLDSLTESDSENNQDSNRLNRISFSGEESEDEKYGLVKYGRIPRPNVEDLNANHNASIEDHMHYDIENDVCLKISIKKLETNVVTVEDMHGSRVSQFTIEEESSASELSEEGVLPNNNKSVTHKESKQSSSESSSVSTDDAPEKSKTIFDDLKLKQPVKRSVKDFVQAFNMLSVKGEDTSKEKKPQSKSAPQKSDKEQKAVSNLSSPKSSAASALYSIQSFPTKWEYQTNQVPVYSANQFLMPIAEESHNDISDKNNSHEDINVSGSNSNCTKSKQKKHKDLKGESNSSGISIKPCTHCSEPHKSETQVSSHKRKSSSCNSKGVNNKESVTSKNEEATHSTHASVAALASLLHDRAKPGPSKAGELLTRKPTTKPDQAIMVSLYIEDKSSHRGPIPLLVTPSMSLRKLKKQVEKEYLFPRDQQCWILGESFAVRDDASLSSYGVIETGCPILLYVMGKDSKSKSLPIRPLSRTSYHSSQYESSTSSESELEKTKKSKSKLEKDVNINGEDNGRLTPTHALKKLNVRSGKRSPSKKFQRRKDLEKSGQKAKSNHHAEWEIDYQKKQDYRTLVELDDLDLVANTEPFECPVCLVDIAVGEGAILQECLHTFCRECLAGAIQYSDTAVIGCPFRNDEYSCESHLQEREIKSLVLPDVYERHLQRSMALAESQADDSFHCKTPDCQGWCLYEDNVNTFLCPVCKHTNCLTCAAIHEGKNCRQFQDDVAFRCDSSEEAKKTKEYLENMVKDGEAMECPKCQVILMKKWGCDWLKCSMCHTEVCWVTKGPRWGPAGKGDTSGGCKCMLNGVRCHPKCSYCH